MKPLLVLIISFTIVFFIIRVMQKQYQFAEAASIAMAIMLLFTALGHFLYTQGMVLMIPSIIPFKTTVVYITAVFEILLAIGLLLPKYRLLSGWALIIFLVLMLPANIHAAIHSINYQKGSHDGSGLVYLWFRVPLQLFFIIWAYLACIQR